MQDEEDEDSLVLDETSIDEVNELSGLYLMSESSWLIVAVGLDDELSINDSIFEISHFFGFTTVGLTSDDDDEEEEELARPERDADGKRPGNGRGGINDKGETKLDLLCGSVAVMAAYAFRNPFV